MAQARSCVVIYNPVKVSPTFRDACQQALAGAGYTENHWLETSVEDPGRGMVARARDLGADLVIAAGGDGTVRVVADGLAGTDIALGVVPEGTANLLAYNLGIPDDEGKALVVATGEQSRRIDLVRVTVDAGTPEHFAVMAGAGLDAMIMDETDDKLKAKIGTAAYFLALGKALGRLPMRCRVRIDGHHAHRRRAMLVLIGNVGKIRGFELLPQATPDDGQFDVMIATPRRLLGWIKTVVRLITRRPQRDDPVEFYRARRVEIRLQEREAYELDGDVAGDFHTLVAEIVPSALTVRVP